nr:putative stress-responsive transcriptional regulator PspC [Streptococcus thermophilus]
MTNQPSPQPINNKKLMRSVNDRYIAGVCGGIAETYNIDATLVRLLFVALFLAGMSGLLIYVICWIVIPNAQLY